MKFPVFLLFICILFSSASFAQEVTEEELPVATISDSYIVTLPTDIPLTTHYKVDISHLAFTDETEATKTMRQYLTGNLITNEVNYAEQSMIIHIHTEYLNGDLDITKVQHYLSNSLPKP